MARPDVWADLGPADPLIDLAVVSEHLCVASCVGNWEKVAEWASRTSGGMWFPSPRGVTWRNGAKSWWICAPAALAGILEARSVASELAIPCGWSVGSVAGAMLRWIGPPTGRCQDRLRLQEGVGHAYMSCQPGQYDACQHYDVSSYYYSLLGRLPSLDPLILSTGAIHWQVMSRDKRERWERVLAAIGPCKWLRNAFVGCMLGRQRGRVYYHRGERREHPGHHGPFATAGCCVVRAAYEITQQAALETDAVWSHTDAVITRDGLYPGIWDRLGFRVRAEGDGPAEICTIITYRCGSDETGYYRKGSRYPEAMPAPPVPDRLYYPQWVHAA